MLRGITGEMVNLSLFSPQFEHEIYRVLAMGGCLDAPEWVLTGKTLRGHYLLPKIGIPAVLPRGTKKV